MAGKLLKRKNRWYEKAKKYITATRVRECARRKNNGAPSRRRL